VSNSVDAGVLAEEVASLEPRLDVLVRHAGSQQLPTGDKAVCGLRQQSQLFLNGPVSMLHTNR
jgi:hypothetical protein